MKLLPILYASLACAAVLDTRQQQAGAELSSSTPPHPTQTLSATTTIISAPDRATTTTAPVSTDASSDSGDNGTFDGSDDGSSGTEVDTDAGASGDSSSSFNLSKGGLIAICVMVAMVVVFGVASTVLFIMAKRRQWDIRASIRRTSRRFTGRGRDGAVTGLSKDERLSRRAGIQMSSTLATRGHKRGLLVT